MLIKELRICDFLVFPGEQANTLPTEGESNLVVILAPNNTGKTNVIRALKFLFYGHDSLQWRTISRAVSGRDATPITYLN